MTDKGNQLTLAEFLCLPFLNKVTKTSFFGVTYLRLINYFGVVAQLYSVGAVLGHVRRNKLNMLAELLTVPGLTDYEISKYMTSLKAGATKRLKNFINQNGREPNTFNEFCFLAGIEGALEAEGISLSPQDAFEAYLSGDKELKKLFNQNVKLKMASPDIIGLLVEGIGFGASFPELTERMYRKEKSVDDARTDTWAHGLVIPEEFKTMSFEEGEEWILQLVALYTSKCYPELIDPLDLRASLQSSNFREWR